MPGAKRGGGGSSSKKSKSAVDTDEGSHIVFTNDTSDSKGKKKGNANKSAAGGGGTGKGGAGPSSSSTAASSGGASAQQDGPKKPDTRTLIGGASWTGKLPLNMLSEHCQKQKWEKPDYSMQKTPEGFVSAVTLRSVHPKTREMRTLPPMKLPSSHKTLAAQPSAVEARHFAAAYALFRVSSMKNIHMMMPPTYRDLWKGEFAELKKEDEVAGRAWQYEADPFAVQEEREAAKEQAAKAREKAAQDRVKEATRPAGPGARAPTGDRNAMKGWAHAPKVEMGKKIRSLVEEMVRQNTTWNPHGIRLSAAQRNAIAKDLEKLGFRKSHIEEAMEECKDREEVLEWLLVHVPDDDLPPWTLPEGYTAGVSMASGDLKREASLKRLLEAGYPATACEQTLSKHDGDEAMALEELQNELILGQSFVEQLAEMSLTEEDTDSVWPEEMDTLKSIYDSQFKKISKSYCTIELSTEGSGKHYLLHVRRTEKYPKRPPVISLTGGLPAYIRLSIYRRALANTCEYFLGEPMIFNIVEWLQSEIPSIIENPGKLKDITAPVNAHVQHSTASEGRKYSKKGHAREFLDKRVGSPASQSMLRKWQEKHQSAGQKKMLDARQSLPAWQQRRILVQTVNENQVTIISGETGSGKSTQSVQFILDDMIEKHLGAAASIICTQPRRISALGLADRVSEERCATVGDEVGYTIRGESKRKAGITKITFVTTGVLLRRLQTSGGTADDVVASLSDVSHVVVDEVHERSLDTDFLLILLRDVLRKRKDLKVILMSATLDAAVFENYFRGTASVGKVEISGRTFPVEDLYLDDVLHMTGFQGKARNKYSDDVEDSGSDAKETGIAGKIQSIGMRINYDLIVSAVQAIDAELGSVEGGILIFLPGTAEITRTVDAFRSLSEFHALPLHASLTPAEQRRVFPLAPKGKRKVIAATNVAETSITIEDIVAVIDTGKVKETSFDPVNGMVKLEEVWASRAACKQRRGRAGRVRAGKCYKLYTRDREGKMAERPDPEIRRVPLEQLCLSVRAMGIKDIAAFLASALTPPEVRAVDSAISLLGRMNALEDGELTALGRYLSLIPADLRCGKLMVYGTLFGCLESCLTVAAILTVRSPFLSPQAKREESKAARSSFAKNQGDLIGDLQAYQQWSDLRRSSSARDVRQWCDENFLSSQTLFDISSNRAQYTSSLKEVGFLPANYRFTDAGGRDSGGADTSSSAINANNSNLALLRALIAGAFHPQTVRIQLPDTKYAASVSGAVALDPEARTIKYFGEPSGNSGANSSSGNSSTSTTNSNDASSSNNNNNNAPVSGRVFVHPSSTLFDAQGFTANAVCLSYFSKIATSKVFVRDLTPFNAYSLLMFGGSLQVDTLGRGLVVDGWLRLRGWARIGVLVSRLRRMLDELLADQLEDPEGAQGMAASPVVGLVRRLVELDGLDR